VSLVISVNGLRESYGEFMAIADVSFEVEEGGIFSILGPVPVGQLAIEILAFT
jgi:ABC-type Na+ transport system ATPase subunit NatA